MMMARAFRILAPLALVVTVGGPTNHDFLPVVDEAITIQSRPVTIQPGDPSRVRVGALTLVGGWRLSSTSPQFGGLSALSVDGDRVTAISDAGSIIRFRLTRFGRAINASVKRLPPECGSQARVVYRDTELLAHDPVSGDWWIGYEWRNAICRVSQDFRFGKAVARPPAMAGWPSAKGPESMLRLPDGQFLVFAEGIPTGSAIRPLLRFDRDPTDPAANVTALSYRPPADYSPTDAAVLPDGRILVMNRRFGFSLFTTVLTVIDPATLRPGKPVEGRAIARFAPPLLSDNFEGLSVTVENGQPFIWIVSDDNFMSWEGTYLLKFAIDPVRRQPQ